MQSPRLARVKVSVHLIGDLLRGELRPVESTTAPADLKVVSIYQPVESGAYWFWAICESSTFDEVPEGGIIPEIEPFVYHMERAT